MPFKSTTLPNKSSPFSSLKADHLALRVPDFDAAQTWLCEKLDFRVLHQWPLGDLKLAYLAPAVDDHFLIELIGGDLSFPKQKHNDLGASLNEGGSHHICFAVKNLKETLQELKSRGVTIIAEPFFVEDIKRQLAFFTDPWNNLYELSQEI
ncbi:VOC family protein [Kiloniella majae]|uniref:VOC family protein n=1 Tax=Kiloniella majae TaxID=1938558 RepID=UPI000A2778F3|nr:VOC family protein [Kiloniella majae]